MLRFLLLFLCCFNSNYLLADSYERQSQHQHQLYENHIEILDLLSSLSTFSPSVTYINDSKEKLCELFSISISISSYALFEVKSANYPESYYSKHPNTLKNVYFTEVLYPKYIEDLCYKRPDDIRFSNIAKEALRSFSRYTYVLPADD